MLLYTWKDVERKLLLNKNQWNDVIIDIETYVNELVIYLNKASDKQASIEVLHSIFGINFDQETKKIIMDLPDRCMDVSWEVEENPGKNGAIAPLFKNVIYQKSSYYNELLEKELPGVPVLAFHSYKGGVGRTLSLLAFVKAWSSLKTVNNPVRLLVVDADIEAPGITWLTSEKIENQISFLDLLEMIQERDSIDEVIDLVADKLSDMTFKIETEKSMVEHIVLPTYRYVEQLLDMYASPESLANSYSKKYILAEVLSKLGQRINAGLVLVDLRAGLSEFSAPLLFDPRVKKYLVTSTSHQSVQGTKLLLQQLGKGLPLNENSKIPEILLTMVQENEDVTDIISEIVAVYDQYLADGSISLMDDIVTELPFASELIHLESLEKIIKNLNGRDFYNNILNIVRNSYPDQTIKTEYKMSRDEAIKQIHYFAGNQISAESGESFRVLMTESIQNLIKKYKNNIPCTVIMGAKGSGKTFLYREILKKKSWGQFMTSMQKNEIRLSDKMDHILMLPLLSSSNAGGFYEILESTISGFNQYGLRGVMDKSVYINTKDFLLRSLRKENDVLEWKEIWRSAILKTVNNVYQSLDEFENELAEKHIQIVFLVDGLEEIFQNSIASKNEKNAISALCRDLVQEVQTKYKNIGLMIFLRKDMVRDSLEVNYEQFISLYRSVELQWSSTEALRLAVWLVNQAIEGFYQEEVPLEMAPREIIDRSLNKLWGIKLGKATSNEANSSRWILAALSDFNGQLQARDIIRFLEKATVNVGKPVYPDRLLMPAEIKLAVSDCSDEKIGEIKEEIKALGPIFDKLNNAPDEKKVLPFSSDSFDLTQAEEKLMKQEGYLRIENDKYYLPEIVRRALKFKFGKGARPKVLSLTLKNGG